MARPGLSFASSILNPVGLGLPSTPTETFDPTRVDTGIQSLRSTAPIGLTPPVQAGLTIPNSGSQVSKQAFADNVAANIPIGAPSAAEPQASGPAFWYNETSRKVAVNGFAFDEQDAATALQADQAVKQATEGGQQLTPQAPTGEGWRRMEPGEFEGYIASIQNPNRGTLFAKGIERGMRGSQNMAGAAIELLGGTQLGAKIREDAQRGTQAISPFQRQVREVDNPDEAIDWAVGAFGEALPSIFESVAAGLAGGGAGVAVSASLRGGAGTLAAFAAKAETKRLIRDGIAKRAAGQALSEAERSAIRSAAATVGAATGAVAQNYSTGVGDIYSNLLDAGVDPNSLAAKLAAASGAVPYAAMESTGEFLLAGRVMGFVGSGRLASRVAKSAVVGGGVEGVTETGQEALNIGISSLLTDREMLTDENLARLIEAGAAGAVVGVPFGGAAGLAPANNLLAPAASAPTPDIGTPAPRRNPLQRGPAAPQLTTDFKEPEALANPVNPLQLPAPAITARETPTQDPTTIPDVYETQGMNYKPGGVGPVTGESWVNPISDSDAQGYSISDDGTLLDPQGQPIIGRLSDIDDYRMPNGEPLPNRFRAVRVPELGRGVFKLIYAPEGDERPVAPGTNVAAQPNELPPTVGIEDKLRSVLSQRPETADFITTSDQKLDDAIIADPELSGQITAPPSIQVPAQFSQALPEGQTRRIDPDVPLDDGRGPVPGLQQLELNTSEPVDDARVPGQLTDGELANLEAMEKRGNIGPNRQKILDAERQRRAEFPIREAEFNLAKALAARSAVPSDNKLRQAIYDREVTKAQKALDDLKAKEEPKSVEKKAARPRSTVGPKVAKLKRRLEKTAPAVKTEDEPRNLDKPLSRERSMTASQVEKAEERDANSPLGRRVTKNIEDKAQRDKTFDALKKQREEAEKNKPTEQPANVVKLPKTSLLGRDTKAAMRKALDEEATANEVEEPVAEPKPVEPPEVKTSAQLEKEVQDVLDAVEKSTAKNKDNTFNGYLLNATKPRAEGKPPYRFTVEAIEEARIRWLEKNAPSRSVDMNTLRDPRFTTVPESEDTTAEAVAEPAKNTGRTVKQVADDTLAAIDKAKRAELTDIIQQAAKAAPPRISSNRQYYDTLIAALDTYRSDLTEKNRIAALRVANDFPAKLEDKFVKQAKDILTSESGAKFTGDVPRDIPGYVAPTLSLDGKTYPTKRLSILADALFRQQQRIFDRKEQYRQLAAPDNNARNKYYADLRELHAEFTKRQEALNTATEKQRIARNKRGYFKNSTGAAVSVMPRIEVEAELKRITKNLMGLTQRNVKVITVDGLDEFKKVIPKELHDGLKSDSNPGGFVPGAAFLNNTLIVDVSGIYTKEQLHFNVAHELFGHMGFAAVFTDVERASYMQKVYDEWPGIRAAVHAKEAMYGGFGNYSRSEAVEEVLADKAAFLETSVILKVWNWLRDKWQKLTGFKFKDDLARHMIGQARMYVRTGRADMMSNDKLYELSQNILSGGGYFTGTKEPTEAEATLGLTAGAANGIMNGTLPPEGLPGIITDMRKAGAKGARAIAEFLEYVQTTDNVASRSFGFTKLLEVFRLIGDASRNMLSKYQLMTETARTPSQFKTRRGEQGATKQDRDAASELLAYASLNRLSLATEEVIKKMPSLLIELSDGTYAIDPTGRAVAEAKGIVAPAEFANLEWSYANGVAGPAYEKKVDADSTEYRVYRENFEAVSESAIDKLAATIEAYGVLTTNKFDEALQRYSVTKKQREWFDAVRKAYLELAFEKRRVQGTTVKQNMQAQKRADDWLAGVLRTLHEDKKIDDWMNGVTVITDNEDAKRANDFVNEFRKRPDFKQIMDPIIKGMADVNKIGITKDQQIEMNQTYTSQVMQLKNVMEAELTAKRTIAGGYVPLKRRGKYQVRMVATVNGKAIKLDRDTQDMMPYFHTDTLEGKQGGTLGAKDIAEELDTLLGDREWELKDERGNVTKVKLGAVYEEAKTTAGMVERIDFNDFMRVLDSMSISLNILEREKIVVALEKVNSRVRSGLQRSGTPGWDKDVLRGVDEYLEMMARVSARARYRYQIDGVMNTASNWFGDEGQLETLQVEFDLAPNDAAKLQAEQELVKYAYMYQHMGSKAAGSKGEFKIRTMRGEQTLKFLGQGARYQDHANRLLELYSKERDVNMSLDDLLSQDAAPVKMATVVMQLGGSFASAALNLTAVPLNVIPYLTGFNRATGRGGGFGDTQSFIHVTRGLNTAGKLLGLLDERQKIKDMVDAGKWADYGLTEDEAHFVYKFTADGHFTPAQTNALIGSQKGKLRNVGAQKAVQLWMTPFNKAETMSRVATGLASYRLYKKRAIAGGADPKMYNNANSPELAYLHDRALETLNYTLGEYAMYNRPTWFRGNISQYIYVYKQFIVTTVQLIRHLPTAEKAKMLGLLFLMSGLKGMPFAEDMMDIIDTIRQALGMANANVELEARQLADSVIPGASVVLMNGVMNSILGGTISTRTGMGDIVPLTGAFKAGADVARELKDAAGPVYGAVHGAAEFSIRLADYVVLQKIGPQEGRDTFMEIARNVPVAGLRSIAEGAVFMSDGSITNSRGQLVSEDLPINVLMARFLGFYPTAATNMNDVIRLSKETDNYAKSIKREYVVSYARAARAGDRKAMKQVLDEVSEWNQATKGTEFEIRDFQTSANRAAGEASRTALQRYVRTTSQNIRPTTQELADAYGIEQ